MHEHTYIISVCVLALRSYVHTYVRMPIYIVDICSKEVSKCTVMSELNISRKKIVISNVIHTMHRFHWYPILRLRCIVVVGIGGKQLTPQVLNKAILSEIRIICFLQVVVNPYIYLYFGSTCAWWQKTNNIHIHTNTWENYCNPHCTCVSRVKYVLSL